MSHTRVETKGSVWLLDDDARRYARMPKHEGPRLSPPDADWGGADAGPLEDLKWHPMDAWEIRENPIIAYRINPFTDELTSTDTGERQPLLVISVGEERVVAPDAEIRS